MMTLAVFLLLVYVSLLLESTWCMPCSLYPLHIDPLPALICWLALRSEPVPGVISVIIAGLATSLFSSLPFYLFPVSYLMAFLTVYLVRTNVLELPNTHAYLMTGFISVEILVVELSGSGNPELLWPWEIVQAVLNIAVSPLVFKICDKSLMAVTKISAKFCHEK